MKFKYHKSYRGFYLLNGEKFERPFKRLDEEKTADEMQKKSLKLNLDKNEIIEIEDSLVVFKEKTAKLKVVTKTNKNFKDYELKYKIPVAVINHLHELLDGYTKEADKYLPLVLNTIGEFMLEDGLFTAKVKKIFYYNEQEVKLAISRFGFTNAKLENFAKSIEESYPEQYKSALPLDYKENEIVFLFYFIILIEMLALIK